MAELNVERKEGSSAWIWIVALIVIALLAWWLFTRDTGPTTGVAAGTDTAQVDAATPAAAQPGAPNEVNQFVGYVEDNRARTDMGRQHEYTADGLRRLASAIDAVRDRDDRVNVDVRQRTDSIRTLADALQRDEESMQHANHARSAFTHAAEAMRQMDGQLGQMASGEVNRVQEAAQAIAANTALTEQRQSVQNAFDAASTALRSMTGTTTAGTAGARP